MKLRRRARPPRVGAWTLEVARSALWRITANDAILPSQLARTPIADLVSERERSLLVTLLQETLRDAVQPPGFYEGAERRWCTATARAWFQYPDDGAISLRLVCAALDLDLLKVQRAAREIIADNSQEKNANSSTSA